MNELAERARRIAAKRTEQDAQQLTRIRDENPIFARMVDDLKAVFAGDTKVAFLSEPDSGLRRGLTVEERAKLAGGLGISVVASARRRPRG